MLKYSFSQFLLMNKITTTKIYSENVHLYNINMLYYDRTGVPEGFGIDKTRTSKECDSCHYWYFLDKGFKFQLDVCNGCHDVLMVSINLNDVDNWNIWAVDYCCIINGTSKSDAANLQQNANLTEDRGISKKLKN